MVVFDRKQVLKNYFADYRTRLNNLLDQVNLNDLEQVITIIITAFKNGNYAVILSGCLKLFILSVYSPLFKAKTNNY